jgi:hypothetical protein
VSESAESAKRGWASFGAKPAQSETPVRAAAERRTPEEAKWEERRRSLPSVIGTQCVLNGSDFGEGY